jgi:hypothetical protein
VTLAARLLLAIAAVTLTTAALAGFAVREAWRRAEGERFAAEFQAGKSLLARELEAELGALGPLVGPLCEHDPIVDSALVGLRGGDLETRRLSVELRVPELGRALALDELYLVTSRGQMLGSLGPRAGPEGARALIARIQRGGAPVVRATDPPGGC